MKSVTKLKSKIALCSFAFFVFASCQDSGSTVIEPVDSDVQSETNDSTQTVTDTNVVDPTNTQTDTDVVNPVDPLDPMDLQVTVYSQCNYQGVGSQLTLGEYGQLDLEAAGIANDDVSSISIPNGYMVTLYQNNLTGNTLTKTQSVSCLTADNFDNDASAIVVEINPLSLSLSQGQNEFGACEGCHGASGDGLFKINVDACGFTDCTNLTTLALYVDAQMSAKTTYGCDLDLENIPTSCAATTAAYIHNHFSTQSENPDPGTNTDTQTDSDTQTQTDSITDTETNTQTETVVTPIEIAPISNANWILNASRNTEDLANAIDGDIATRWATEQVQTPGQWISIDLQDTYIVGSIELDAGTSLLDFPQGFEVYVSDDGVNWGEIIASGVGEAVTIIEFDQIQTQHIRIVQTGSSENKWLSIHELSINGAATESTPVEPTDTDTDTDSNVYICPDMPTLLSELNCTNSGCHATVPGQAAQVSLTGTIEELAVRFNDSPSVNTLCKERDEKVIDVANPSNSLMLKLVNPHVTDQCSTKMPVGTTGVTDDQFTCFESWVDEIAAVYVEPEPEAEPFVAVPAMSALTKVKNMLHGGVPTQAEINTAIQSNELNKTQLINLVDNWMETPEFETKFKSFLSLALQQNNVNAGDTEYRTQLDVLIAGIIDGYTLKDNLEESFVRTAFRFVDNDEDFRQIATTQTFDVTTAMLLTYSYVDYQNRLPFRTVIDGVATNWDLRSFEDLCGDLDGEAGCNGINDYNDWRQVTFNNSLSQPAAFTFDTAMAQSLRNIPNGGNFSLHGSRVGYFTTPVFLQSWLSNEGNKFRVTINQTLITGLGLTFEGGDITQEGDQSALDTEHAGEQFPECYACHRLMDPMRQVFDNVYTVDRSRVLLNTKDIKADFAFHGHKADIDDLYDLGEAIASHPNFGKGWVGKLCNWATSVVCDQSDSEFLRLVEVFESNDYKMKPLIRELFSSPLVTGVEYIEAFDTHPLDVVINRTNHFCATIKVRLDQARAASGYPVSNRTDICDLHFGTRAKRDLLPKDEYARGAIDLVQAVNVDPFLTSGYSQLCDEAGNYVVSYGSGIEGNGGYDNVLSAQNARIGESISLLATYILGIPESDPQNAVAVAALQKMYDIHSHDTVCEDVGLDVVTANENSVVCGFDADNNATALKAVWTAACSAPSVMGMGF